MGLFRPRLCQRQDALALLNNNSYLASSHHLIADCERQTRRPCVFRHASDKVKIINPAVANPICPVLHELPVALPPRPTNHRTMDTWLRVGLVCPTDGVALTHRSCRESNALPCEGWIKGDSALSPRLRFLLQLQIYECTVPF